MTRKPKTDEAQDIMPKPEDAVASEPIASPAHAHHDDEEYHHPDLVSPLDGRRIEIATKKEPRIRTGYEYDAIVLGAGPAGETAAMKLAKSGYRVAVIDPRDEVGGNCAHVGTIPSKALRQSVFTIISYRRDPLFDQARDSHQVPLNKVLGHARRVIRSQVSTHQRFYERNNIEVIHGWGRFVDEHTLDVYFDEDGSTRTLTFNQAVIAVGSRPYRPEMLDFEHPRVFDSDTILQMDYVARKIIIYGAGVIGCEYASIFTGLGYVVDLVNNKEQLLSYLDEEISDALSHDLRQFGVRIRNNEEIDHLEAHDDYVILHLKSGKKIKSDAILWCNGRSGNTDSLNLEAVGLKANRRGQLEVNQKYQTSVPHIYAAGDVLGRPGSTHSALLESRVTAHNVLMKNKIAPDYTASPRLTFTFPGVASVGLTEDDCLKRDLRINTAIAPLNIIARSNTSDFRDGFVKLLVRGRLSTSQVVIVHGRQVIMY